jgi:hypothetical protein
VQRVRVLLLLLLLVVWTVVAMVGAMVQGLFWLTVVGTALFLMTGVLAEARLSRAPR